WTNLDHITCLEFLIEHKAEAGDGRNFKIKTFYEVAIVVNAVRSKGGPKTANACQTKYAALKKLYQLVLEIKNVSGWSWDEHRGVNVSPATQGTWD
ncbi:hypothetical protein DFH07DRAFT_699384, partial [Mycena maculata]